MSLLQKLLFSVGIIGAMKAQNNFNEFHDGTVCIEQARTPIFPLSDAETDDNGSAESIYSTDVDVDDMNAQNRNPPLFLGASRDLDVFCGIQWDIKMVTNAPSCDGELCFALKNVAGDTSNVYLSNELFLRDRITASSQELWFVEPAPNGNDREVNILSVVPNRANNNNLLCRNLRRKETELRSDSAFRRRLRDCQWKLSLPTKRRLIAKSSSSSSSSSSLSSSSSSSEDGGNGDVIARLSGSATLASASRANGDEMDQNQLEFVYPASLTLDPLNRARLQQFVLRLTTSSIGFGEAVHFRAELSGNIARTFIGFSGGQAKCTQDANSLPGAAGNFEVTVNGQSGDMLIRDSSNNLVCVLAGEVQPRPVHFRSSGTGRWSRS